MASPKRPKVEQMAFVGSNIPQGLKDRLDKLAEVRDRSLSYEIRRAIEAHVEAHERRGEADGGAA